MSKKFDYQKILKTIISVTESESNLIANLSNISAILMSELKHHWIGFYLVDQRDLVLGPFQGPLACTRIAYGRGVCGDAWKYEKVIVVDDVDSYEGHIACSVLSKSEIVLPIFKDSKVVAVLDIDSENEASFDSGDEGGLAKIADYIGTLF